MSRLDEYFNKIGGTVSTSKSSSSGSRIDAFFEELDKKPVVEPVEVPIVKKETTLQKIGNVLNDTSKKVGNVVKETFPPAVQKAVDETPAPVITPTSGETLSMPTPNLNFWGKAKDTLKSFFAPKIGIGDGGFDILGTIKNTGILSESPEKTADKEAVTRVFTKTLQDAGYNVNLDEVKTNFDALTKQAGLRDQATNEEFTMSMLMGLGAGELMIAPKLVPSLIKTGLGLAGFEALNLADRKINKLLTGTEQTTAQAIGRSLDANEGTKAVLFIADMFAKGGLLYMGGKGAINLGDRFWTEASTKYNLPKNVFIDSAKVKSIFQTGEKISPEEMDLIKSLGLFGIPAPR